ncbi:MAG: hypothetical protein KDB23_19615, partial [Planctomycetales bacterium]|nr:hypothetical protein [Planctomycetales bacterium]
MPLTLLVCASSLLWLCAVSHAQVDATADRNVIGTGETNVRRLSETGESVAPSRGPVEVGPRIKYWAQDKSGQLYPLIDMPLEQLERLLAQQDGLNSNTRPPRFKIDNVAITGRVVEATAEAPTSSFAELDVTVDATVLPDAERSETWTALPLRFHEASLVATPKHEGSGDFFLVFDEREGYQVWLRYNEPGVQRIQLQFQVPLSKTADSTQLRFYPPLANRSELALTVPGTDFTAQVENGRNLTLTSSDAAATVLEANDLRNQVIVTWRRGGKGDAQRPAYLDVQGTTQVSIEGPGAIRSSVTLDLTSWGQPIQTFSVRLPPHTKIVSEPGYSKAEVSPGPDDDPTRSIVEFKLEKPALQARIQFWTQTTDLAETTTNFNVASFEVIGAIRQWGRITLLTSEDYLVYWNPGPSVHRVQNIETIEATPDRKQYSFEYFRQPCELNLEIVPQATRLRVEPAYKMTVSKNRVALEAQLDYRVNGAPVSFLEFSRNGWELDEIRPAGAIENDDFPESPDDKIKMRLTKATSGDISLTLLLHRPIETAQGTFRLPLPWPTANAISRGSLLIESTDAVQLNYRVAEMTGFAPDPLLRANATAANGSNEPRLLRSTPGEFRILADRDRSDVVFDYAVRDQEIRVRADTTMDVNADTAQISQRLDFRVLYEPATQVALQIPPTLFNLMTDPRFQDLADIRLDGKSLGLDWLQDVGDEVLDQQEF